MFHLNITIFIIFDVSNIICISDLPELPDPAFRTSWRPRENTLVATLSEHRSSVNQLAVSSDHTFFASASSDQTIKIWRIRGIDRVAVPRSSFTYKKHQGAVTSAVILENSHSVASCSEDGSVHVWRLDNAAESQATISGLSNHSSGLSISGDKKAYYYYYF